MNFSNVKILWCLKNDPVLYWVHNLTEKKMLVYEDNTYDVYYSDCFDVYFFYYKKDDLNYTEIISSINILSEDFNNYVHVVLCDFRNINTVIDLLETQNKVFYSCVNHVAECIYDTQPIRIKFLKNIKYYFSCSDLLNDENQISEFQKTNKFVKDYKYSLTYFYFKLGFNFIQKENKLSSLNDKENKFFLYTKSKKDSQREKLINLALDTKKIKPKEFTQEEYFWFKHNNQNNHMLFMFDYTLCKFNLVMETQPLTKESNNLSRFVTEKTLKTLMVPTPSYLVSMEDTYNELKDFGFYFLNEEFGEYNFNNYEKFCEFLKKSDDSVLNDLYDKTIDKSKKNKNKLEEYIYSDKIKELNLLINKQ